MNIEKAKKLYIEGKNLFMDYKNEEAKLKFEEALENFKDSPYAFYGLYKYYDVEKDYERKERYANWAYTAGKSFIKEHNIHVDAELYKNMAYLCDSFLSKPEEALEHYKSAITLEPSDAQLYNKAAYIYEEFYKDNIKAEDYYKKSISIDEKFDNLYNYAYFLQFKLNRFEDAMLFYKQALVKEEGNFDVLNR